MLARRAFFAWIFVLLAALASAPTADAAQAKLRGKDALATLNGQTTLQFKVKGVVGFVEYDAKDADVEFFAGQRLLGTARSDREGFARLRVNAGAVAGDLLVTGRLKAGGRYRGPDGSLLLAVRDAATRVIISDVDWTLSAAEWWEVLVKPNSSLRPVKGALKGIEDLKKDATVVYLTARQEWHDAKTKAWLAQWGFPRAVVITSDDWRTVLGDPTDFKTQAVRGVKTLFANTMAGFGDLTTDAQAYHNNGLPAFIFDTHKAGPYQSFAIVHKDWDELRTAHGGTRYPALAWATSFR